MSSTIGCDTWHKFQDRIPEPGELILIAKCDGTRSPFISICKWHNGKLRNDDWHRDLVPEPKWEWCSITPPSHDSAK